MVAAKTIDCPRNDDGTGWSGQLAVEGQEGPEVTPDGLSGGWRAAAHRNPAMAAWRCRGWWPVVSSGV